MPVLDRKELEESPLSDLHAIASELGIEGYRRLRRDDLIDALAGDGGKSSGARSSGGRSAAKEDDTDEKPKPKPRSRSRSRTKKSDDKPAAKAESKKEKDEPEPQDEPEPEETEVRGGVLDILPNGSGFMRPDAFAHSREDVYVSPAQIRRCELRAGDELSGPVRPPRRSERYPSLVRVDTVNGQPPEPPAERPRFDDLTPMFAGERLPSPDGLDGVPYGKGSRVAISGPPGAGATTLLRRIVEAVFDLGPTVVVAGVRPEEVTEWRRWDGLTVAGGAFDGGVEEQAQVAEMAIERAKRAVEQGRDAIVAIDSLDALPPSVARRVFGAARRAEEGGSLTVIAVVGESSEPLRVATTRIVLENGAPGPASGTTRADLLGA